MKNLEHIEKYHAVMDGRSLAIMREHLNQMIEADIEYGQVMAEIKEPLTDADRAFTARLDAAGILLNNAEQRLPKVLEPNPT